MVFDNSYGAENVMSSSITEIKSRLSPIDLIAAAKDMVPLIAAGSAERDDKVSIPLEEVELVRKSGILAARVPKRYGGPEASFRDIAEITMALSEGDPNLAQALSGNFMLDLLLIEGSEDQRQRYFGQVLEGAVFIHALAERGTKFIGNIKTTITPDGEGYRIDGTKFYSTGSLMCDVFLFTGKMENGDLTYAFVPRDRAGLTVDDDWDAMGQRTTASGTTHLENVYVAAGELVSVAHWPTTRNYFGSSYQLIHAAIDTGIARAALGDAIRYAREKARPVLESGVEHQTNDPYVLHAVGQMEAFTETAEAMVLRGAEVLDRAATARLKGTLKGEAMERLLVECSIAVAKAKAVSNDVSLKVCEMLYQVGGASATLRKYNFDRHWRNARTHTLHDPVAYKYKAIGDYYLNDRFPPISTKY